MQKFLLGLALAFSLQTRAHYLAFEQRVYDAIDLIHKAVEKDNLNFYYDAASALRAAAMVSKNTLAKKALEKAILEIATTRRFSNANSQVLTAKAQIQEALKHHHDSVALGLHGEAKLMENLIKAHLFPEIDPKDVNIIFKGPQEFSKVPNRGLVLLASFIADPRSKDYDDQIHQLIEQVDLQGRPATLTVEFSNSVMARTSSRREAKGITDLMNILLEQNRPQMGIPTPMRMKYRIVRNEYWLYFEVHGYKFAEYLNLAHRTFAFMANETTTYRILKKLEEYIFYLSHFSVPFNSKLLGGALAMATKTADGAKLALRTQREAAEGLAKKIFARNTGDEIIKAYEQRMDQAIAHVKSQLQQLTGATPPVAESAGLESAALGRRGLAELLPERVAVPSFGPEGDGTEQIFSREEVLRNEIAQLTEERAATLERMKKALNDFRQGGVELDVIKKDGRWVKSSSDEILSVAEYKEYLEQQLEEVMAKRQAWGKKMQAQVAREIGELHKQKKKALAQEQERFRAERKQMKAQEAKRLSQRRIAEINKKFDLLMEEARQRPRTSIWTRYTLRRLDRTIASLQEQIANVFRRAELRMRNLGALPVHVRNAREALISAKASGPIWGKHSMHSWNADRGLFLISAMFAGIQVLEWQFARSQAVTQEERDLLWQEHGPKIYHMSFYCVPYLNAGVFVMDLSYWMWTVSTGLIKYAAAKLNGEDTEDLEIGVLALNGTELLLRKLFDVGEWIGYKISGTNSWQVSLAELYQAFGIAPLYLKAKDSFGQYYFSAEVSSFLTELAAAERNETVYLNVAKTAYDSVSKKEVIMSESVEADISTTEKKLAWLTKHRLDFIGRLQAQGRRYLAMMLEMNFEVISNYPKDVQEWIMQVDEQLFGSEGKYKAVRRALELSQKKSMEWSADPRAPLGQ